MKDQTVRRLWLTALLLLPIFDGIALFENLPEMAENSGWMWWVGIESIICYSFYYCAYKNPGTKLLTFSLFLNGVRIVVVLFMSVVWKLNQISLHNYSYWAENLLLLAMDSWWWFLCLRMASFNDQIRANKLSII